MGLEKQGVFKLVPITPVLEGHKVVGTRWVFKIKADSTCKGRLVVQGLSQILGMNVTHDHEKGARYSATVWKTANPQTRENSHRGDQAPSSLLG